jgi:hypothetical protein
MINFKAVAFGTSAAIVALTLQATTAWACATPSDAVLVKARLDCKDARYPIGAALIGTEEPGGENVGEVAAVDRIVAITPARTSGFLYTLRDGTTYVSARSATQLTNDDLVTMNQLLRAMGYAKDNTADPSDNGFVYFRIRWDPKVAKHLGVRLARCEPPSSP